MTQTIVLVDIESGIIKEKFNFSVLNSRVDKKMKTKDYYKKRN